MDQRRPSISEGSAASEDLAAKDLPSRSYFSFHAQPDIGKSSLVDALMQVEFDVPKLIVL